MKYYKRLNKKGEVCEVVECADTLQLGKNDEWATQEEYKAFVDEVNAQKLLQSIKLAEKKIDGIIKIDHYLDNARIFHRKQPFFFDEKEIWWVWAGNKWQMTDEIEMARMLDERLGFMGQTVSSSIRNNHITALKWVGREHKPKDAPIKWLQFKSKAYSLESGNIYDVTPDYFFTNPIPWELGESEDTPVMDKLITEWVGEKYKQTAYEIIAYCCLCDYPIHLAIF